jgi:hypothetical protein
MRTSQIAVCGLVALVAAACAPDLSPGSRVTKLRVLALAAEPSFARPGETVELSLLVADAEERALSFAFGTCSNAAGTTAGECLEALDAPVEPLTLEEGGRFTLDVPEDILRGMPEESRSSAYLGAVVVACPGTIERGQTSGVPVVCRDEAGERLPITEFEVGVKRIYVRDRDRNESPRIARVTWDGEEWPEGELREARACENETTNDIEECAARLRHRLRVDTSEPESGRDEHGVEFSERQIVQYYATHGVFERAVRIAEEPDNQWAAQRNQDNDLAQFWFVVRDDRGGVTWTERQVRVR